VLGFQAREAAMPRDERLAGPSRRSGYPLRWGATL